MKAVTNLLSYFSTVIWTVDFGNDYRTVIMSDIHRQISMENPVIGKVDRTAQWLPRQPGISLRKKHLLILN